MHNITQINRISFILTNLLVQIVNMMEEVVLTQDFHSNIKTKHYHL